jgi:hypothetical protein
MPQRASVFCNFYIRVDREALVSERALNVGSVAFKAMSTKNKLMSGRIHYTIVKTSAHMVNNFKNGRYVLKHGYWLYLFEITARYDNEKNWIRRVTKTNET